MKKFCLLLISMVLLPCLCLGQAKIYTKKVKLSDFPTKTTKIVLTGNDLLDSPLKEEIARRWRISPYEFCEPEEYDGIKKSTDYYFIRMVDINGVTSMSLSKEGLEVINLPYCTAGDPSGREILFMPAFIDILQTYVLDSINSDMTGYLGLKSYTKNMLGGGGDFRVYVSREDLAAGADSKWEQKDIFIVDEDDADDIFLEERENALVSYCVKPAPGSKKRNCYVFLIDAKGHKLYFYASHKASDKNCGFTSSDMNFIYGFKKK